MSHTKSNKIIAWITALFLLLTIQGNTALFSYGAETGQPPQDQQEQPQQPQQPQNPEEQEPEEPQQPEPEKPDLSKVKLQAKAEVTGMTSVKVSWGRVQECTGYELAYRAAGDKSYKQKDMKTALSYSHKSLKCGTAYYYKVRGYVTTEEGNLYSPYSAAVKAVPKPGKAKITSLKAGEDKVTVRWSKISGVSGYRIYRSTSAKKGFKAIATVKKADSRSYTNTKLSSKKKYYFKVRAYKNAGKKKVYGEFSQVKGMKPLDGLDIRVTKVYQAATKNAKTKEKKLRACYDYMIAHYTYTRRSHVAFGAKGWQASYAEQFLKDKTGNCFGWAAVFYYLAKKCGYSPRIYSGSVHYANGNTGRHGWTEITIKGRNYIFDPEMDWSYTHRVGSYYNGWKRVPGTTSMRYIK